MIKGFCSRWRLLSVTSSSGWWPEISWKLWNYIFYFLIVFNFKNCNSWYMLFRFEALLFSRKWILTCFLLFLDISEIAILSVTRDRRIPLLMHFSLHCSFHSISELLNSHLLIRQETEFCVGGIITSLHDSSGVTENQFCKWKLVVTLRILLGFWLLGEGGHAEERGHCYMCKTIMLAQIVCRNILRQPSFIISSFVVPDSHPIFTLCT